MHQTKQPLNIALVTPSLTLVCAPRPFFFALLKRILFSRSRTVHPSKRRVLQRSAFSKLLLEGPFHPFLTPLLPGGVSCCVRGPRSKIRGNTHTLIYTFKPLLNALSARNGRWAHSRNDDGGTE